jgi:hypothetical protein
MDSSPLAAIPIRAAERAFGIFLVLSSTRNDISLFHGHLLFPCPVILREWSKHKYVTVWKRRQRIGPTLQFHRNALGDNRAGYLIRRALIEMLLLRFVTIPLLRSGARTCAQVNPFYKVTGDISTTHRRPHHEC